MIDVYKIVRNTKVEGPGNRFCLWVQGCSRHCEGCYAKSTWEFGGGKLYSVDELYEMIVHEKDIQGVTFLGGEPFEQASELSLLAQKIKAAGLSLVCFTGFVYEELAAKKDVHTDKMLSCIDLLVDGAFEINKFDLSRPWVGSANQRYIFLTDKYSMEDVNNSSNKAEVRISKNGTVFVNGMGDFNKAEQVLNS